jgi:hypothetical protein
MRRQQVLAFLVEAREPHALRRSDELRPRLFRQGEVPREVPLARPSRTFLRWAIAYEPHPGMAWAHPVLRPYYAASFRSAFERLARFLERTTNRRYAFRELDTLGATSD